MRARVKWLDHMSFVAESGSGHSVVMDGSPDHGGRNLGFRPMEMLLMGLGGCTAYDVVLMLQKARQVPSSVEVELEGTRAEEVPQVFRAISVHFRIVGNGLTDKQVGRAVQLSAEKYCSATRMLESVADITTTYEIVSPDTAT